MLKTRAVTPKDLGKIKELHQKFYSELQFPEFMKDFLCGFIIEDENDEIVIAGGVERIAEGILFTNKDKSNVKIGRALVLAQDISVYVCQQFEIRELHAFIDHSNEAYIKHFLKHGFHERNQRALSMRVPNGT